MGKKSTRRVQAREAVEAMDQGWYRDAAGRRVEFADALAEAVAGTRAYEPGVCPDLDPGRVGRFETALAVANETSLAAARRLVDAGHDVLVLNFASAKNAGGGFLGGAEAQEEFLARSSGLYACIRGHEMYRFHRGRKDNAYTDYMLYSPGVPVLRNDDGAWLDAPYRVAMLTAPAVNAGAVLRVQPERHDELVELMRARCRKVLAVAAAEGHDALVLGAWGCGVFRNPPGVVARLFGDWLRGEFAGVFRAVSFAVLDRSKERRFVQPFEREFGVEG